MDYKKKLFLTLIVIAPVSVVAKPGIPSRQGYMGFMVNQERQALRITSPIIKMRNSYIAFLENKNGKRFILKQDVRNILGRHLTVAREALASLVARSAGVRAHVVKIIPRHYAFPGKKELRFPATLHEVVPGFQVNHLTKEFRPFKLTIQQHFKSAAHIGQCGLTREVIRNMAFHPDLPQIVAFDTCTANGDRHRGNFFYDPVSNHYYAIDLESAFENDLAIYACALIKSMIHDPNYCVSVKELQGLCIYRDTLKRLLRKHTPDSLHGQLVDFAIQSGFFTDGYKPLENLGSKLEKYRIKIGENYESCQELVRLLDRFIKRCTMRNNVPHAPENAVLR